MAGVIPLFTQQDHKSMRHTERNTEMKLLIFISLSFKFLTDNSRATLCFASL